MEHNDGMSAFFRCHASIWADASYLELFSIFDLRCHPVSGPTSVSGETHAGAVAGLYYRQIIREFRLIALDSLGICLKMLCCQVCFIRMKDGRVEETKGVVRYISY